MRAASTANARASSSRRAAPAVVDVAASITLPGMS